MSDAFSLPSNSDLDQSRSSDYDMFDDEDEEGDNQEINRSSPDNNDLGKWSDKQWYNLFTRSMVPNGWPEFRRQNFQSPKYWIDFSLIDLPNS
jgi:hypothetical protein